MNDIEILEELRYELGLYVNGEKVRQGQALENLIQRNKELEQIEKEHKEENGELRERIKELEEKAYKKEYYEEVAEELYKNSIPKSKVAEILKQRLKKYQDADDGRYKQEYLTRGELELVDRYKECSELLKILCEEDIYKIELDYIPKSKVKEKIEELIQNSSHFNMISPLNYDKEYYETRFAVDKLQELLGE